MDVGDRVRVKIRVGLAGRQLGSLVPWLHGGGRDKGQLRLEDGSDGGGRLCIRPS